MQTIFVYSCDDYIGPESATISAVSPSFVFYSTLFQTNFEFFCRLFVLQILFAVKYGKMLAYNVVFFVAFQELGTCVPGSDITLRIEKEDSIIFDSLNKNSKRFICG